MMQESSDIAGNYPQGHPDPGIEPTDSQESNSPAIMTRHQFDEQLDALRISLCDMASAVDAMLELATRALAERNVTLAEQVLALDDRVDDMDLVIEQQCMRLIALQQPMARDLRLIGTALKLTTDLERMGDHAVDIAKAARKLAQEAHAIPLADIPKMAEAVRAMLADAMRAFTEHDLTFAQRVVSADDEVDKLFHEERDRLHGTMRTSPELVVPASYLILVAHYYERVADHAVNIAERVYYVETGRLAQLAESHRPGS